MIISVCNDTGDYVFIVYLEIASNLLPGALLPYLRLAFATVDVVI